MDRPLRVIGVDLGGTKLLAGVVGPDGGVDRTCERETPVDSQATLLAALDEAVAELLDDDVAAVGFGIPSQIDRRTGLVEGSVNIPLEGVGLAERVARRFGVPTFVENDANAAALAEYRLGAGRGSRTMVMLTLGTGCGGGVVLDGALYRGAAELGHMVVVYDGAPCQGTCTGRGHLESYVTGGAATRAAQAAFGVSADSHSLVALADAGDPRAREILAGIGRILGAGIGSLVNVFAPEVVAVGGGFAIAAAEHLLAPAREIVRREAVGPPGDRVEVVVAELRGEAGVVGAALVALEALAA